MHYVWQGFTTYDVDALTLLRARVLVSYLHSGFLNPTLGKGGLTLLTGWLPKPYFWHTCPNPTFSTGGLTVRMHGCPNPSLRAIVFQPIMQIAAIDHPVRLEILVVMPEDTRTTDPDEGFDLVL